MSPKRLFSVLFVLTWMTLAPTSAALAQEGPQVTPFFGFRSGGSFRIQDTDRPLNFQGASTFGIAFDYGLTHYLELELMWSRQRTNVELGPSASPGDSSSTDELPAGTPLFDVTTSYFHGGVLYGGGSPRFHPYVAGGVGFNRLVPDSENASSVTKFSFSVGLGFKTYVNDRFGFRFDVRALGTRGGSKQEDISCGVFGCASFKTASTFWQANYVGGLVIKF